MYVLQGSQGQITTRIARRLLAAGHPVRVLGRQAANLVALARAGADIAVGEPDDATFLTRAFHGATAVYTMIPPCFTDADMRVAQDRIGIATAQALATVGPTRVVHLSSIGAELTIDTGPIRGLQAQEARLQSIAHLDLLLLRPGSFMENLLAGAEVVAASNRLPGLEAPDARIPMVAVDDIAAVAAEALVQPNHRGVLILHADEHPTMRDVAATLGHAIGQPALTYQQIAPAEARSMLLAQGFSPDATDQLAALARWLSTSPLGSTQVATVAVQPTTLADFARRHFAPAHAAAAHAAAAHACAAARLREATPHRAT